MLNGTYMRSASSAPREGVSTQRAGLQPTGARRVLAAVRALVTDSSDGAGLLVDQPVERVMPAALSTDAGTPTSRKAP